MRRTSGRRRLNLEPFSGDVGAAGLDLEPRAAWGAEDGLITCHNSDRT